MGIEGQWNSLEMGETLMNPFFTVFDQTQQFLILQGYADEILTEAELMTFLMQKTTEDDFVFVVPRGIYLVLPALSLDDFESTFVSKEAVAISRSDSQLTLKTPDKQRVFKVDSETEAENIKKDIEFLFAS